MKSVEFCHKIYVFYKGRLYVCENGKWIEA